MRRTNWRSPSRITWASRRQTPGTISSSAPPASNTGTAFATRRSMAALRECDKRGGLTGCGDEAGFLYSLYGFGMIREMELQKEAGFPTVKVIQHATSNSAKSLGQEPKMGKVRAGYLADLIVVNGNPVEDLKILYPTGIETWIDGKPVHGGGVEWTVKDGIPYHA